VFPPYQHKQIRLQLASNLKAVISQRLVNRQSGEGRVPAVEILINNSRTKEMIENPDRTREMHQAIAESHVSYNMQTFDQSLMQLLSKELISYEEALKQSSNPHDFALRASGIHSGTDANWDAFERSAEAESALIPNAQEPERAQKK
jgi:twitching motility protein PilT